MGTGVLNMTGPYDPATKTITFTGSELDQMTGKDMTMHETIQMPDGQTQIITMYDITGGKNMKMMEIKLKRM
jgi:hypothetical protein